MGLLNKFFGADRSGPQTLPASATHLRGDDEDANSDSPASRNAGRRELIHVVLRETMRRHAIPSDWIDCRILPVIHRNNKTGVHVHLVVKQGQGNLLTYIPAFQSSLMAETEKFDPRAWDWLLSISWQFEGITSRTGGEMPSTSTWGKVAAVPAASSAPKETAAPAPAAEDDDVSQDLQALFAIRDAAMKDPSLDHPDFEATQPGFPSTGEGKLGR